MTEQEKQERLQLNSLRSTAVRNAWKHEQALVRQGRGTRNWSIKEQKALLKHGRVPGYEGHHMKSVRQHPTHAGERENIQFLTEKEHLKAHQGSYRTPTNGYYDAQQNKTRQFQTIELRPVKQMTLNQSIVHTQQTKSQKIKRRVG